ncbi:MAG: T9SS type A sorting domain-containing protein [Bacteroidota bacterium]
MKKFFMFYFFLISATSLVAQTNCSDIFISEYVEGWNNNKSLELYNPTSWPITLDNQYRLVRWANGSTTSDHDSLYVLPLTTILQPYAVMVIIQDTTKPGQDTMIWPALRKKATWLAPYDYGGTTPGGNVVFWNGDDAISLQRKQSNGTWTDIDIFGEIGVRPTNWQGTYSPSGGWTDTKPYWRGAGIYLTKSKTLKRKHTILHGVDRNTMIHYGDSTTGGLPNSFFALPEYDSMPVNFFDSLGQHWCDCQLNVSAKTVGPGENDLAINLYYSHSDETIVIDFFKHENDLETKLELISMDGRVIKTRPINKMINKIDISSFPEGIYFAKITLQNSVFIKKFIKH